VTVCNCIAGVASAESDYVATGPDQDVVQIVEEGGDSQQGTPLERLVQTVWNMYSSDSEDYHPESKKSERFRWEHSDGWGSGIPAGPQIDVESAEHSHCIDVILDRLRSSEDCIVGQRAS
jgi:hypothetical protein